MLPPDHSILSTTKSQSTSGLERILRAVSLFTMVMTVPQVLTIWVGHNASGVSILSWGTYLFSALLWLGYGIRKRDKTIYLACIGWIALDAAVVLGVIVNR
jgi:uncharacterized protein with PQ loop repeat